ncbi:Uncharacterised protein [Paenibacillus polymyxa]|uniref:Uncharacterized protein n=1 Tax=Paenibacillus polymyxa TaxID=1406 RepID=A0A378Y1B6_PAEPO|nr:Uncharacterised protein [Paenibacillus polymyxa]
MVVTTHNIIFEQWLLLSLSLPEGLQGSISADTP